MAIYISYTPNTAIGKAMFNFDAFGLPNYKLDGTIRVSVSDSFSFSDFLDPNYSSFDSKLFTSGSTSNEVAWTGQMLANIQETLGIFSQFANIAFDWRGDYDLPGPDSTPNPEDVGRAGLSDINITWLYRSDAGFAGVSGAFTDSFLGYTGAAGDIFLNSWTPKFGGDDSLDLNTRARQTLMHELGHSLGLSHPHTAYNATTHTATVTADYSATKDLGFDQLGFRTNSASDMYKEYFTIMSYDDQQSLLPGSSTVFHAHTPMILDVIALQAAYGDGAGTHGSGNDMITAGTAGYRTYFDTGGTDTIDLSLYDDGAYLHMGASITGAAHMVGVAMSLYDAQNTILFAGDPAHLRWFYGEYENALGSSNDDLIIGNSLGNGVLAGLEGNDILIGELGNDTYWYRPGDGQDIVGDIDSTPGNLDSLRFDVGILPTDIGIYRSGTDLVLVRRGTFDQDRVTLQEFDLGANYRIEQVTFTADATVWGPAYLLSHVEQAGAVLTAANAARVGQPAAVPGMFQVVDPDGGNPYSFELWDGGVGGGYFRVGGIPQAAGVAIPVSAGQLATTDYFGGAAVGSETVYVRAYDGVFWTPWASWTMYTHNRATNNAPTVNAANANIDVNQWRQVSELVSIADADADPINQLQIRDLYPGATSGYLWANGANVAQGATLTIGSLAGVWVNGGPEVGLNGYQVRAFDGVNWGAWTLFSLSTRLANRAPVTTPTAANQTVVRNAAAPAGGLFGVSDLDGDTAAQYEFWDSTGGGYFRVLGIAKGAGVSIPVSAAQLGTTEYVGGAGSGSESVYVRAHDGQAWSGWASWTMQTIRATNANPVVAAANRNTDLNQWRLAPELAAASDADGDAIQRYEIRDLTASANSGYLYANGASLVQGATVSVTSLATTWVRGGAVAGADNYEIRALDSENGWSSWTAFSLNTRTQANRAPAATPTAAIQTVTTGNSVAAGGLFGVGDPDGDAPFAFELWDGGAGGGYFRLGGVQQAAGVSVPVGAAQLATTDYVGGAVKGTETVFIRVNDGQAWSAWASWTMQTLRATNANPVVTAANRNIDLNQWRLASELATVTDADGDAIQRYEIRDLNATANSGYLWANGTGQAQGATASVTSLTDTWVRGAAVAGADGYEIRAQDSEGAWGSWAAFSLNTRAQPNRAPVATPSAATQSVQASQAVAAGTLFGVGDLDGDAPFALELWDGGVGGGFFRIGGVQQAANASIALSAAQLATTEYVGGASPGGETLWVRVNDGQASSGWASWNMNTLA